MFKRVPLARTKDDSDMQPIALPSSPAIANTAVAYRIPFNLEKI